MNNNSFKSIITAVIFVTAVISIYAQPDWSIDPAAFEFTMTVSGIAINQCVENLEEEDIVAAFVGENVRGVQTFDTESEGHAFAFMIVYDSITSGNEVTFKVYDASADTIYDAVESVIFQDNAKFGTFEQPFTFSNDGSIDQITISGDKIANQTLAGTPVGELSALNHSAIPVIATYEFIDDANGTDNDRFGIDGNHLVIFEDVDYQQQSEYRIHLQANVEEVCSSESAFILYVSEEGTVGIHDRPAAQNSLKIFPNPVDDILTIEDAPPVGLLQLIDLSGNILIRSEGTFPRSQIDMSQIAPGFYFLVLHDQDQLWVEKVNVQR